MVDSLGWVNAVTGSPEYNGRMLRQLNAVGFAGATAARPLGARSGVRPGTSATTVTATSTTWTCQPFAGLLDGQVAGEAGPYPFAFDAVATGSMTAADASNPRIDILYVDVDDPSEDASSVPAVTRKYLAGVASGTPSAPAAPAGCIAVANINVPKSGGGSPTVTWVAPYVAAAGAVQDFNTKAQMELWLTAPLGQKAKVLADGAEYVWTGSAWKSTGAVIVARAVRTATTPAIGSAGFADLGVNANWTTSGQGHVDGFAPYNNGWTIPADDTYEISYNVVTNAACLLGVSVNVPAPTAGNQLVAVSTAPSVQNSAGHNSTVQLKLNAGDVIRLFAITGSGSTAAFASVGHFTVKWVSA